MKHILPRIALSGTENRRMAIINFLEENNIPYEIEEIPHLSFNFDSKFYKQKKKKDLILYKNYMQMMMSQPYCKEDKYGQLMYQPYLETNEENEFIEDDILENQYFEDMYDDYIPSEEELEQLKQLGYIDDEIIIDEDEEELEEELEDDRYITEYLYNIIVTLTDNYEEQKNKLLFTAHYDVVRGSTGANDNASSITILLKLALELSENKPSVPTRIVFFDGEETGGIGSRHYADEHLPTEELKNETTMINLDVCGCGDYIVIVNNIQNPYNNANILICEDIKERYNIVEAKSFPFSDASIFKNKGIGSIGISVFPVEDVRLLNEEIKKQDQSKKHFGSYIWDYMHNGKYDDISYINYNIMQLTLEYIKNSIY